MRAAVAAVASLAALAMPAAPPALQTPKFTREAMESAVAAGESLFVVYGTQDPQSAPVLRERGVWIAHRLLGADSSRVIPDRALGSAGARGALILIGGPRENSWTARLAPALPVTFTPRGFRWQGTPYERPDDAIHLAYPNPLAPRRFLLLLAGNSPAALAHRGGFLFGVEDWRIYRDGELARSGRFAQSAERPWRYDPALDRDREAERERFHRTLRSRGGKSLEVRSAPELGSLADAALQAGEKLLARLDGQGLGAPRSRTVVLTLYRSLEEKGQLTRDTRPEHLDDATNAHAALPAGRTKLDLWSVAGTRLRQLGAAPAARYLEPAAVGLCDAFEGEPLATAVSRLYYGRVLPRAREVASRDEHWRSPLIWVPARAVLTRAIFDVAGRRGSSALLAILGAAPPGTLDSLCRVAGIAAAPVEARYAALADSLARAGVAGARAGGPVPWRVHDGFQRGVCLAHAVRLEGGYLSSACARELARLERYGVSWVSITPFGYLPSPNTPEIWPSAQGGVEEESDEAIAEAAARARALGMRVWLTPHLWTRGWVGTLEFGAAGWPKFFDRYREFLLHQALLAQRERIDGLVVGHELVSASLRYPDRWRALIAEVRRVYSGTLTYGANWGEEVKGIAFWDALDLVGVSFYEPLAKHPTRSPSELMAGAQRALAELKAVGARAERPVLLLEVGYPSIADAAERPWEEGEGATDPEMQRLCYQALTRAMEPHTWIAGAFFWKWYSEPPSSGPGDRSYSPQGKPAEAAMAAALKSWIGRPVQVARATKPAARP